VRHLQKGGSGQDSELRGHVAKAKPAQEGRRNIWTSPLPFLPCFCFDFDDIDSPFSRIGAFFKKKIAERFFISVSFTNFTSETSQRNISGIALGCLQVEPKGVEAHNQPSHCRIQ
jgi:hypothetical protein